MITSDRVIVVPCFNEAARLDIDALVTLAELAAARIITVDDGSTDGTGSILAAAARDHDAIDVLALAVNGGKAEAVRAGLRTAVAGGAAIVGYFDADLATPPTEMARLVDTLAADEHMQVMIGSRVGLLGHDIDRSLRRHYLGRLFATVSSAVLDLPVYDTQCGAKAFRVTPAMQSALADPFTSRWAFDVELLGRLRHNGVPRDALQEMPLRAWHDVGGSKLGPMAAVRAGLDLLRLGWQWRGQRSV
jgi:dolichyl-phosphate beta-glucosyltransferase